MLGRIAGRIGRVYGDGAYAGGPTYRAVAGHRQVPPNAEGVFRPKAPDVRVAATLVFSAAQALLAAKAGASVVTVPVDQLDALGQDSTLVLDQIRRLFDRGHVECDLVAAFPRSGATFTACAQAGADAVSIDLPTMRALLVHPLTDRGIDAFLRELSTRTKPRIAPV